MPLSFLLFLLYPILGTCTTGWTEKGKSREVHIQQGLVRGFVVGWDNANLKPIEVYLGIPYAAAPVGSLRYMPPQSPQVWDNENGHVKMAVDFAPVCPQILPTIEKDRKKMTQGQANYLKRLVPFLKVQSEDCLTLNIYAPLQDNALGMVKKSVLVFIHGESFSWNSGNPYDGSVLTSYTDVIVVTLNFRLGVLGFLKSSSKVSNLGLLDQIAALKWLKDNIEQFGGDPGSVTLMGHHTGAIAVNHLMFSPIVIADQSPGLFQRVILVSGSALATWSEMSDPERNRNAVAEQLNCNAGDDDSFQECLRDKSVGELLNLNFPDEFAPSIGDMVLPGENVKTSPQYKGFYSRYDLMCGFTENECYNMIDAISLHSGMLDDERDRILSNFFNTTFKTYSQLIQKRATEFYSKAGLAFRDRPYVIARDSVLGILNDVRVINPVMQTALHHSNSNQLSETYMYIFSHKSSRSEYTGTDRSVHGEELPYIFGVPLGGPSNHFLSSFNLHEKLLSEVMMTMWSNFIKTGDPNTPRKFRYLTLSARDWAVFEKLTWPKFEVHNQSYYNFAELRPSIGMWYRSEYMDFWNNDLPIFLDRHSTNLKSREENFFQRPPIAKSLHPRPDEPPLGRRPLNYWPPDHPLHSYIPMPSFENVENKPSNPRENSRPNFNSKFGVHNPRIPMDDSDEAEKTFNEPTDGEESPEKGEEEMHIHSASSFVFTVIVLVGLVFVIVNVFLFVVVIRQKRKLCMSNDYARRFGCGPSPSLPDSNEGARDEKFEIKSILKSADQLYDAVLKRTTDEWPDIYRPGSSSTVTVDPHTKVAEWMGQKVKNTNIKQQNLKKNKTDRSSDTDNASAATTSKASERKAVKKVSVAVDATPSTRSASVLKQIPIELTKSLDCGRKRFGGGRLKREGAISEDESPLPSHKHSLSDPVDFPPSPLLITHSSERVLKSFSPLQEDINVTSRDDTSMSPPMSPEEALDNIKRRNFPKVLPDFPEDEPEGAARLKRMSLPGPAETLKELGKKNPPPPPPPRVSTLFKKTNPSNRNTVPNLTTTSDDIAGAVGNHSKHDEKPDKNERRPEPRVIIKPTLMDPNLKKNVNSKIPRVTSKSNDKLPPSSPSISSKRLQMKDPPKKPPGGVGAKLKVHPVKRSSSSETNATSGTSGSSASSAATVKKGH